MRVVRTRWNRSTGGAWRSPAAVDHVPWRGIGVRHSWAGWTAVSGCDEGQAGAEIMAQWSDGFQCHIAGTLHGPLVVLLEQQGADEADHGSFVWKYTNDPASPFDLAA